MKPTKKKLREHPREIPKKEARVGRGRFTVVKVTGPGLSESLYDQVRRLLA